MESKAREQIAEIIYVSTTFGWTESKRLTDLILTAISKGEIEGVCGGCVAEEYKQALKEWKGMPVFKPVLYKDCGPTKCPKCGKYAVSYSAYRGIVMCLTDSCNYKEGKEQG